MCKEGAGKTASKKVTDAKSETAPRRASHHMSPFDLNEFLCEMQTVLGCAPSAGKVVLATPCSGLHSLHS